MRSGQSKTSGTWSGTVNVPMNLHWINRLAACRSLLVVAQATIIDTSLGLVFTERALVPSRTRDKARSMKLRDWLDKWGLTSLKINLHFLEAEWAPKDADKDAAWELYIELLTRITTQPLPREHGVEATALASVHALFWLTREAIKRHGRPCQEFTKIAIVVLNQVVRPFTAK